jgi:RNA polymerase sigma-70 factor (ECF subfamily)
MSATHDITRLLIDWSNGDRRALDELAPLVEGELHRLARSYMRRERRGHLLQTTALVNEAYIRLIDQSRVQWKNRSHFFAIAATMMRRILVNHAQARMRLRRGADATHVELDTIDLDASATLSAAKMDELLALNEALEHLTALDERKGRVVELRYFGGLNVEEVAGLLDVSVATVDRDWDFAKSWLYREMLR